MDPICLARVDRGQEGVLWGPPHRRSADIGHQSGEGGDRDLERDERQDRGRRVLDASDHPSLAGPPGQDPHGDRRAQQAEPDRIGPEPDQVPPEHERGERDGEDDLDEAEDHAGAEHCDRPPEPSLVRHRPLLRFGFEQPSPAASSRATPQGNRRPARSSSGNQEGRRRGDRYER